MPTAIQINLMNAQAHEVKQRKLFFARIQFYAAGILVIYLAILLLVIGFRGITLMQLQRTKERIQQETLAIAQLSAVETKYTILHNKLSLIRSFWGQKTNVKKIIGDLNKLILDKVTFSVIGYTGVSKNVVIEVRAKDVFSMSLWLTKLENMVTQQQYGKIEVGGVARDKDGNYTTKVTLYLQPEVL